MHKGKTVMNSVILFTRLARSDMCSAESRLYIFLSMMIYLACVHSLTIAPTKTMQVE